MQTVKHPGYFMFNELDLPRQEWERHVEYRQATSQLHAPASEWLKMWDSSVLNHQDMPDTPLTMARSAHYAGFMDAITAVIEATGEIMAGAVNDSVGDEDLFGPAGSHEWN